MTRSERYFKKGFGSRKQYKNVSRKQERMLIKNITTRSTDLESYYNDDSLLVSIKSRNIGMSEELECVLPTKFLHDKINDIDIEDDGCRVHYKPVRGGIMIF